MIRRFEKKWDTLGCERNRKYLRKKIVRAHFNKKVHRDRAASDLNV